jgi:hypothetical protein
MGRVLEKTYMNRVVLDSRKFSVSFKNLVFAGLYARSCRAWDEKELNTSPDELDCF